MAITPDHIRDKLTKELAAVHVDVEDTSPNRCAASYKVLIVSPSLRESHCYRDTGWSTRAWQRSSKRSTRLSKRL
ncbi:hypothetical protein WMY93_014950 [Mugilogobius chulae]|uniref:BolA-like protein n=1 Tax=Mugilogobius chulae TaxID=88201 RepID=A0AAW0P0E0_9GOBI